MSAEKLIERLSANADFQRWRHELHAHPELAFEERWTSDFIAGRLASMGIPHERAVASTGIVATLRKGTGTRAIALRADMDALPIAELNDFAHRSQHAGRMHACGHDGHVAMLLAAASYLSESGRFDGTVHFIFQPAEEDEGGASRMIAEGLFERFPASAVYGMHIYPDIPLGTIALREGGIMASCDDFEIVIRGRGGHAAIPHQVRDPIIAAAHVIVALQSIVSRNVHPLESLVVSVTAVHAGTAFNVVPDEVQLRGTARALLPALRDLGEQRIGEIATSVAQALGCTAEVRYRRLYPVTVNTPNETRAAIAAASDVLGAAKVDTNVVPDMGSEDFGFMLEQRPGCYVFLGNGPGTGSCLLHNARFDFNDAALPVGAAYWVRLVERELAAR